MRAHQTDPLSLDALRTPWITGYLVQHGWKQVPFPREGLLVFEGPADDSGEPIVQVIPRSEHASDFGLRAQNLVDALSIIEDRPAEEIVGDIRAQAPSPTRAIRFPWSGALPASLRLLWIAIAVLFVLTLGAFVGIAIVWNQAKADHDRSEEIDRKLADAEKKIPGLVKQEIERALQAAKSSP
jgi:hypothetical protein